MSTQVTTLQCEQKKKIVGVMVNGGAFYGGAYSNGFLSCMSDNNITISQYVGVSSGFFACFANIAGITQRGYWGELHSPLYSDKHNFNIFRRFLEYYVPKVVSDSKYTETELLEKVNQKLSCVAMRFVRKNVFPLPKHDVLTRFKDMNDFIEAQLATGSLPWFAYPWPHKYRGNRYYDGAIFLKNPDNFLDTDIKIVIQPHLSSPVLDNKNTYNIISGEIAGLNKLVNSPPEDIDKNWLKGYTAAEIFLEKEHKNFES